MGCRKCWTPTAAATATPLTDRRKNRAEITLNQNLWEGAGSLSLSAVSEDYWNSERNMQSLSAGYNNSWNGISYGFNYSYNRNSQAIYGDSDRGQRRIYDRDQLFAFNISVPLEKWLSNTYATYSLNTSQKGNTSHTAGLNGTALAGNNPQLERTGRVWQSGPGQQRQCQP